MAIRVDLDILLVQRKMTVKQLSELVDISPTNLSVLKNGHARAIRFSTLAALCQALECEPGDILRFDPGPPTN